MAGPTDLPRLLIPIGATAPAVAPAYVSRQARAASELAGSRWTFRSFILTVLAVLAAGLLAAYAWSGPTGTTNQIAGGACEWAPGFHVDNPDSQVAVLASVNDGGGLALFAGGGFTWAGGARVNHIAKWNGTDWSPLSGPSQAGTNGWVSALVEFDDGTGPALYAGGSFTSAGGITVNHVAKWDGTQWSPLSGPGNVGTDNSVIALAVYDDGSGPALYAGGSFATAGGVTVNRIAKWDGTQWSALAGSLGTGIDQGFGVYALAVHDDGGGPALYAAGFFWRAGGTMANSIAKWDGLEWSALIGPSGNGVGNFGAYSLADFDDGTGPALFVGGSFTTAGGLAIPYIAKWDGAAWSELSGSFGTGVDNEVWGLAVFDDGRGDALYAGGQFLNAGGLWAKHVARWDGMEWETLSGPEGTGVLAGIGSATVYALIVHGDGGSSALHVGGHFTSAGGIAASYVASWDGTAWSPLRGSGRGLSGSAGALVEYDDGAGPALYAGGGFKAAGGIEVKHVAKWDGSAWTALQGPSGGVSGSVAALAGFDDGGGSALYAGGSFPFAGGLEVNHIAKWNGTQWAGLSGPAGTGVGGPSFPWVGALLVHNDATGPALYAGGDFSTAGGIAAEYIAKWDGASWMALPDVPGVGLNGPVRDLAVYDDGTGPALYAAGGFTNAGGNTVNYVARWDGNTWSPLTGPSGTGTNRAIFSLEVFDDGTGPALFFGGWFDIAGGVPANYVAKWDGNTWSALSTPPATGLDDIVSALAVYDDGAGPALYAGGEFVTADGVILNGVAKWDGTTWTPLVGALAPGVNGWVHALGVYDNGTGPDLVVGGQFSMAGGIPSSHIAVWDCPSAVVFADGFESGDISAWSSGVP